MALVVALAAPTFGRLLSVLSAERKALEQLLFRHTQLELLLTAGEHRFIARALDDIADVEDELGALELTRAAVAESVTGMLDTGIEEIVARAPESHADAVARLHADLVRLFSSVEESRARCRALADRRVDLAAGAIDRLGASGYGPDGYPAA